MSQQPVLYLGEINDSQQKSVEDHRSLAKRETFGTSAKQLNLFPDDGAVPIGDESVAKVRLNHLAPHKP